MHCVHNNFHNALTHVMEMCIYTPLELWDYFFQKLRIQRALWKFVCTVVLFIFKKLKLWIIVLITCLICLIVLHINQLLRIRECLKINWYNDAYTLFFLACRKGWTLFAGYCYYFSAIGTTWNQAEVIPLLLSIPVLSVAYSRNIRV